MTAEVETALLAAQTSSRRLELAAERAVEGRVPNLVAETEEIVLGIAVTATAPHREIVRPNLVRLAHDFASSSRFLGLETPSIAWTASPPGSERSAAGG